MRNKKMLMLCALVCIVCLSLTGCNQTLRKKFVRKKKSKDPNIGQSSVVLVPEEYNPLVKEPIQVYEEAFMFATMWSKDFLSFADEQPSAKRITYVVEKIRDYVVKMSSVLPEENKAGLMESIEDLNWVLTEAQRPERIRNHALIVRKVRKTYQLLRRQYKPSQVEELLSKT